ncbi:MAG: MarR family transcriptional regulator [Acholeplasmatales bacterium]|nr:MarR family transcriptional regulator [Acholeplasmatales bacterium]
MSKEFFYRFGKLIYKIDYFYAEVAKKSGVKPNLMWILYALNDGESHSQKEISISWDIPITTINTIVKKLNDDGYVDLIHIPGKRRDIKTKGIK